MLLPSSDKRTLITICRSQDRRSEFTKPRARVRSMVPTKLFVHKGQLRDEGMEFAVTPDLVSSVD